MGLKREKIELIKNPEEVNNGAEPEIERVWTVPFIPLRVSREAANLLNEIVADTTSTDDEKLDKLIEFVVENAFGGKITKDDIYNRLPGPGFSEQGSAQEVIEHIIFFMATGEQMESTKKFLAEKA